jgi:hypothetical protein
MKFVANGDVVQISWNGDVYSPDKSGQFDIPDAAMDDIASFGLVPAPAPAPKAKG